MKLQGIRIRLQMLRISSVSLNRFALLSTLAKSSQQPFLVGHGLAGTDCTLPMSPRMPLISLM